jgi:hypothetical protein
MRGVDVRLPFGELDGSLFASFQATPVALEVFGAACRQSELSFLKFPTNLDEALLFGFIQCPQAGPFGRRLPVGAVGAVQQYHYLDNLVSPCPVQTAFVSKGWFIRRNLLASLPIRNAY